MDFVSAYAGIKDSHSDNDTKEIAQKFARDHGICTGIIGYRDIPNLLKRYSQGTLALDYGCGAGYSTEMLHNLGYHVFGVDISDAMLEQAISHYPNLNFLKVGNGNTPFPAQFFDVVLSTFVLFDIPSITEVTRYLKEVKRVLKPNGVFLACTGSEVYHLHNWLTEKNTVEKNQGLKSGQTYRVHLTGHDIVFCDYFYSHADYLKAFDEAGLTVQEYYLPLGKDSDNINWTTEWTKAPYSIYVCSHKSE